MCVWLNAYDLVGDVLVFVLNNLVINVFDLLGSKSDNAGGTLVAGG